MYMLSTALISLSAKNVPGTGRRNRCGQNYYRTVYHEPCSGSSGSYQKRYDKLEGKNVLEMSERELEEMRGNDVAIIFQDPMTALNPV